VRNSLHSSGLINTYKFHSLLQQGFKYYADGQLQLRPPGQAKLFEAAQIDEALRYLQKGSNSSGIVVSMPKLPSELPVRRSWRKTRLRADRTYLLIGGLGGIGWSAARLLVEKGARHLIFFSRSAAETWREHPEYLRELQAQDCTAQAISGRIENLGDVQAVVKAASLPIAGVLQAAMVLEVSSSVISFGLGDEPLLIDRSY
jgi:hypothetical protein